jgi:hypothetical protein
VFQAVVNESVLHRDPGLGDTWECPLPNGYALLMIDTTDNGWVYNPKTQADPEGVADGPDTVSGVIVMQVAGRYMLGGADSKSFEHTELNKHQVDSYFLLDAQTSQRSLYSAYDDLLVAAHKIGIEPKFEPIATVYSIYRFTWFEVFAGFLLCVPPLVWMCLVVWWVSRLRKGRMIVSHPA